jgi:hypothetical protein
MIDTVLYTTIIVSAAYFLWRFTVEWIDFSFDVVVPRGHSAISKLLHQCPITAIALHTYQLCPITGKDLVKISVPKSVASFNLENKVSV